MFGKTHIIIAISKEKIIAAKVKAKGNNKIKDVLEYGFDVNTLDVVFENIKQKFKVKSVRILVGDSLSYVLRLKVPTGLEGDDEREFISKKISEKIPEVLGDSEWDYKDLHFNVSKSAKSEGNSEKDVIVFSPVRGVFRALSQAANKVDLKIEAIEPEAVSKTRDTNPLIGLAMKSDIEGKDKDVLNLEPINLSLSVEEEEKEEEKDGLLVDEAKKLKDEADMKDKDDLKDVLADVDNKPKASLSQRLFSEPRGSQNRRPRAGGKSQKSKMWVIVPLILLLLGGGVFAFVYFSDSLNINIPRSIPLVSNIFNKDKEEVVDEADQSITEEEVEVEKSEEDVSEEVEEELFDLADYNVQVQNGSGIAGEADEVSYILLAEGFSGIETANADSYDYEDTEVKLKKGVSSKLFEEIERALNSDYSIASEAGVIDTTSDFDVIVIVGERL